MYVCMFVNLSFVFHCKILGFYLVSLSVLMCATLRKLSEFMWRKQKVWFEIRQRNLLKHFSVL